MTPQNLANLAKIGKLKAEPPAQAEFDGLLRTARARLQDAGNPAVSLEGRFTLAYGAAHAFALAALRWHGYRSEDRYIVFQALPHTLRFEGAKWQALDHFHRLRNRAEYEGTFEVTEELVAELIGLTRELRQGVEALGPASR